MYTSSDDGFRNLDLVYANRDNHGSGARFARLTFFRTFSLTVNLCPKLVGLIKLECYLKVDFDDEFSRN